ncbi:hypothetical protein QCA50_011692 [Cerrena zonata]|uniref:Cation/H+ exchanger transmembrane domain-containing protein n=1 Tax=Cerrena zonata TaxID=2478898 RepID=A0AAW0FUP8_9APHY
MKFSLRKGFIDRESYIAQFIALALFTIGVTSTIGSDDLLAAFAAGSAISWDGHFNTQVENLVFSSVIDLVLNCGCFVYIGAWLPFSEFNSPELGIEVWKLVVLFIAILALRRIPPLLLLYKWVPEINGWKEALFSGHFGPMGVGAVFISTLALTRLPEPHSPPRNQEEYLAATLQTIVSFVVLGSIFIHGLSIPFFSFGRRVTQYTTGDADLEGGTPETLNSSGEGLNKGGKDVNAEVIGEPGKLKDTGSGTVVISEQEASSSGYNTPGFLRETGKVEDGIGRLRRRGLESSESGNVGTTVPNQNGITSRVTDTENSVPIKIHVPTQGQDSLDPILISERLNRMRSRSPSASGRARLEDRDGMGEEGPGSRIASGSRTPVRMVRFPGDQ